MTPYETGFDVGTGGDPITIPLAEYYSHVTAVEQSERMREQLGGTA